MNLLHDAPRLDMTLKGAGVMMKNQATLVRFLLRHWPISLIGTIAIATQLWKRHKEKSLTWFTGVTDVGTIVAPVVGLLMLNKIAIEAQELVDVKQAPAAVPGSSTKPLPVVPPRGPPISDRGGSARAPLPIVNGPNGEAAGSLEGEEYQIVQRVL